MLTCDDRASDPGGSAKRAEPVLAMNEPFETAHDSSAAPAAVDADDTARPAGVLIEHIDGQWAVQIVEDGEVTQRLFEEEEFARSFAAGQRLRLGLPADANH
jgi:hypothetical protein